MGVYDKLLKKHYTPPQRPVQAQEQKPDQAIELPTKVTERPNGRTDERPNGTRQTKRHSYEFYVDQIDAIKRLAREAEDQGGEDNKSKIVREALDEYLAKRFNRTDERTNGR